VTVIVIVSICRIVTINRRVFIAPRYASGA